MQQQKQEQRQRFVPFHHYILGWILMMTFVSLFVLVVVVVVSTKRIMFNETPYVTLLQSYGSKYSSSLSVSSTTSTTSTYNHGSIRLNVNDNDKDESNNNNDENNNMKSGWHIKPIKPHHDGQVLYMTDYDTKTNELIYKRQFTAPCGYGMLVFNVGPALEYEPYMYDLYDDAYAYSNNDGLCFLYPSYKGIQSSNEPFWSFNDPLQMNVPLGDIPTQISTRVVTVPHSKPINHNTTNVYHGGDYLIIRDGNFYNPSYYKHLKSSINRWTTRDGSNKVFTETDMINMLTEALNEIVNKE